MTTRASFGGTAVGSGCARGNVCIVRSPTEGLAIAAGDVLVAPSTDPAWTPLFLKAGALIMETGGYLSHGAIVAVSRRW
jgi:rifampicin phosphotransferase